MAKTCYWPCKVQWGRGAACVHGFKEDPKGEVCYRKPDGGIRHRHAWQPICPIFGEDPL